MTKGIAFRVLGLVICCVLLAALLTGGAQAQPPERGLIGHYQIESGLMSGGGYRLATANWQVSGTASGGGYRLAGPRAPESAGSGCCCTYLPCVMRQW